MDIVFSHLSDVLDGLWLTVRLTVLSFLGAMVIGTVVAILRVSPIAPLRAAGLVYVEFFRNIPLLSLLFLVVFGLPDLDVTFSLFTSFVVAMSCFSGAFVCEAVRTGINTVPIGQAEAARAIGLGFGPTLREVILPQAYRGAIAPLGNTVIALTKNTTVVATIGVAEP